MLSSPRLYHQGKYVELANEDEFDYPQVNGDKFNQRAHAPIMSKDEKRQQHLISAREVARRKQFDHFSSNPGDRDYVDDPVDRVITKGLAGRPRVTRHEPHAECIGHNSSPVGSKTRVFQSPPRSGTTFHDEHRDSQPRAFRPVTRTSMEDPRFQEYPSTSTSGRHSESSQRGHRMSTSSSRSSGIARDVRMTTGKIASGSLESSDNRATVSRSFTVKRKVKGAPNEKSKPHSASTSLTAVRESNSEHIGGGSNLAQRKSVKDMVEDIKREAELKRASAEAVSYAAPTPVANRLGSTLDRISEQSVARDEAPSTSWHSRTHLYPKQTQPDEKTEVIVKYPVVSQSTVKSKKPPTPPPRPRTRPSVSELPPPPPPTTIYPMSGQLSTVLHPGVSVAQTAPPRITDSQKHVPVAPTTRRPSIQSQSPRKRKLSVDRRESRANERDIVDHVQGMLDSISRTAFQQGMPAASASRRDSAVRAGHSRVTQIASVGSDLSDLTFSPGKTSTPIQSRINVQTDVQKQSQIRSDRSMIQAAMDKRRLRIADSTATTWPSDTTIQDVTGASGSVSSAFPSSQMPSGTHEKIESQTAIKARRLSSGPPALSASPQKNFTAGSAIKAQRFSPGTSALSALPQKNFGQTPRRRRSLSTPASPVFSLTGSGARGRVQTGARTAPSSPISEKTDREDRTMTRNDGIDNDATQNLSPTERLFRQIRSRRQSYGD